jgi:hypothetical protein
MPYPPLSTSSVDTNYSRSPSAFFRKEVPVKSPMPRNVSLRSYKTFRSPLYAILIMGVVVGCGDGSSSETDRIATDAEIVALCEKLIGEIETSSSAQQLAALQEFVQYAAVYY